jgi:plasmid stabilization system protein ParE
MPEPYIIVFQPGAAGDIDDAYHWYEEQQAGLGELFLKELVTYYKKLEQNPEIFSKATKRYRQAILDRFPYVIIYEITKNEIHIYSVFHTSRSPREKFKKR